MHADIVVLPGDGIGPEVTAAAVSVLKAAARRYGHTFRFETRLIGGAAIDATGESLPEETKAACLASDAVLLGAVGGPKWDGAPVRPEQGLLAIRKLGTFVEFSVFKDPVTVDWTIIGDSKELNIHGAHLSPNTYPHAIRMLAEGRLPIDDILSHTLPLSRFREGIDIAADGRNSLKVILEPGVAA